MPLGGSVRGFWCVLEGFWRDSVCLWVDLGWILVGSWSYSGRILGGYGWILGDPGRIWYGFWQDSGWSVVESLRILVDVG